jgi:uncharacterized membrane protein YozB (DUF420 family)
MDGLLGTKAGIQADLNLLLHLAILLLIVTGFTFARRKRFEIHEKWMFSGIVLVAISFFAWMAPSYIGNFHVIVDELYSPGVMVTNIHVALGTVTGILAIYIILRMKFDLPQKFTVKRVKRLMRTTFTLWWLTFIFGLSFYHIYYVL